MVSMQSKPNVSNNTIPKIAIIGCGAIADEYYLPAISHHREILDNLILVDKNMDQVRQMANKYGIKTYMADYQDVLENVDGAIIALPTSLHHPISIEFLSRGKHVLCEKPMAESSNKATEMVDQAKRSGSVLAVNYLQRFIPSFAKVKELLTDKIYGEPLFIRYYVGEEFRWPTLSGFYFNAPISSRGILRDRGAHVMDHICWWLGGKPDLISSQNDSFGGSEAVSHVKFIKEQCKGDVKLSWLGTTPSTYSITCEKGTIHGGVYDYQSLEIEQQGRKQRITLKSGEQTKEKIAAKIVGNFINVIVKGEKPLVSGMDALDSITFIDECYEAATRFDMPWYEILEVQRG